MTRASCRPVLDLVAPAELENRPDRLGELLGVLADLVVETRARRLALSELNGSDDPRVVSATESLSRLECHLVDTGVEAATVHNELQRAHLL
jgi:hypothetical protein